MTQDYARDVHLTTKRIISEENLRGADLESGLLDHLHDNNVKSSGDFEKLPVSGKPVEIYTTIGEVVKTAESGRLVAVYGSNYRDQDETDYFCFLDKDTHDKFTQLIGKLKDDFSLDVASELRDLVGSNWVDTAHLYSVYKDGVWKTDLGGVSQDEISIKLQRDDDDWFDAQREYFSPESVLEREE